MNSSTTTESADAGESKKIRFGEALLQARERRGDTIPEVAKATHLAEPIIDALEQSDMERLPPPAFVQGYLRTYARYLELPEQKIVDDFNHAVPYKRVSQLQPRATVPPQVGMDSPWVRGISILLIFIVVIALVYGGYGYYTRTAKTISRENTTTVTLKPSQLGAAAGHLPELSNSAQSGPNKVSQGNVEKPGSSEKPAETTAGVKKTVPASGQQPATTPQANTATAAVSDASASGTMTSSEADNGTDVLDLTATDDSWVEISDAAGHRLYHDLFRKGQTMHLKGKAPFDVFLGNAPAIDLRVNGAEVKMDGRIRSNKVAHFTVTTSEGNVVFR